MQDNWWLWFMFFMVLLIQLDHFRRRVRVIEAKLDAALRRLGDNPVQVEAGVQRADQAAEADINALALRSLYFGLVLMVVGGGIGALVGWIWGTEGMAIGAAVGAPLGYFLGIFLYGFREGIATQQEGPQSRSRI